MPSISNIATSTFYTKSIYALIFTKDFRFDVRFAHHSWLSTKQGKLSEHQTVIYTEDRAAKVITAI